MNLCRFWQPGQGASIGLIRDGKVYNLTAHDEKRFGSFTGVLSEDQLPAKIDAAIRSGISPAFKWTDFSLASDGSQPHLLAPITKQEVWAAGVTYFRSREARMEESSDGGSFYDKVYQAPRPELFFKGTASRVSSPNAPIRIRSDSKWNVPEPELALLISPKGRLAGFTVGNDVSSRDIEGENPLYLPQAKVYQGSCALGPTMLLAEAVPDPRQLTISLLIRRGGEVCFEGSTSVGRMKRSFEELIAYLFREQEFPHGVILLTGTGIVPSDPFTLQRGDWVEITIPEIGTLRNVVA